MRVLGYWGYSSVSMVVFRVELEMDVICRIIVIFVGEFINDY